MKVELDYFWLNVSDQWFLHVQNGDRGHCIAHINVAYDGRKKVYHCNVFRGGTPIFHGCTSLKDAFEACENDWYLPRITDTRVGK